MKTQNGYNNSSTIKELFIEKIDAAFDVNFPTKSSQITSKNIWDLKKKWLDLLIKISKCGKISSNNTVTIFDKNDLAFTNMIKKIDEAKEYVWLETYIFDQSKLAETFFEKLRSACLRNCHVILHVDWIGGMNMKSKWIDELRRCGCHIVFFNNVFHSSKENERKIGSVFFRNHRKLLIIDDETAFLGSLNISEDAAGKLFFGNDRFYDVHLMIEGPCIQDLKMAFLSSLSLSGAEANLKDEFIQKSNYILTEADSPSNSKNSRIENETMSFENCLVQILESNVQRNIRDIQFFLDSIISQASFTLNLTTSYFLPPGFLRRALQSAIRRGVKTDILLSGRSDIIGDVNASLHILKKFLSIKNMGSETNVYLTNNQHCHAKVLVVDDFFASIGSYNWDRYSSRRNLEITTAIYDHRVANKLREIQQRRIEDNVSRITYADLLGLSKISKIINFICYYSAKLLGKNIMDGLSDMHQKHVIRRVLVSTYLEEIATSNIYIGMIWGIQ